MFLDFEKAFDKAPHEGLLQKTKALAIGVKYRTGLSHGLVIINSGWLLLLNALVSLVLVLVALCPRARSRGHYFP